MVSFGELMRITSLLLTALALTVTVAAVVLLIDLLRATRDELNGEEAMEKRKEIENALAAIKQCQSWSAPARGSARVIGYLLGESGAHTFSLHLANP